MYFHAKLRVSIHLVTLRRPSGMRKCINWHMMCVVHATNYTSLLAAVPVPTGSCACICFCAV